MNGGFVPGSVTASEARPFTAFAEEGQLAVDYDYGSGPVFEAGLRFAIKGRFGVLGSVTALARDGSAAFRASIPHPLYLDRPRAAAGEAGDLAWSETAGHLDAVYSPVKGRAEVFLFAGVSFFRVRADLLERIAYDQAYPYDDVTNATAPVVRVESSPVGWNAGAGVDYGLGKSFALGAQVRYARATARLAPPAGTAVEATAGGFELAAGVRLRF